MRERPSSAAVVNNWSAHVFVVGTYAGFEWQVLDEDLRPSSLLRRIFFATLFGSISSLVRGANLQLVSIKGVAVHCLEGSRSRLSIVELDETTVACQYSISNKTWNA